MTRRAIRINHFLGEFGDYPPPRFEIGGIPECFDHDGGIAFDQHSFLSSPFKPSEKHEHWSGNRMATA